MYNIATGGDRQEVKSVRIKDYKLEIEHANGGLGSLINYNMSSWFIFIPIKKNVFNGDIVKVKENKFFSYSYNEDEKRQTTVQLEIVNVKKIPLDDIKYLRTDEYLRTAPSNFIYKTVKELKDTLENRFTIPFPDYSPELLDPAVNEYNDAFFKDHILIMYHVSGGGDHEKILSVYLENDELNVVHFSRGPMSYLSSWFVFIPIKKNFYNGDIVNWRFD